MMNRSHNIREFSVWITTFIIVSHLCSPTTLAQERASPPGSSGIPETITGSYCRNNYYCAGSCRDSYQEASRYCSCHPACELFQDCCFNTRTYSALSCSLSWGYADNFVSIVVPKYLDYFQCIRDESSRSRSEYWMVSKCPESRTGVNHCDLGEDDTNVVVGRFQDEISSIPVISSDGVTFRNIYCAACHGVDPASLTPWKFAADGCSGDISGGIVEKVNISKTICQKTGVAPPANHSLSAIPCQQSAIHVGTIDTCKEYVVDEQTIYNCSKIVAPLSANGSHFKNEYCLNCSYHSTQVEINIANYCRPVWEPRGFPRVSSLVPISITFDFSGRNGGVSIDDGTGETVPVVCDVGQVFDPIALQCVFLSCPNGYVLVEESCVESTNIKWSNDSQECDSVAIEIRWNATSNSEHNSNYCKKYSQNLTSCLLEYLPALNRYTRSMCSEDYDSLILRYTTNVTTWDETTGLLFLDTDERHQSPGSTASVCNNFQSLEIWSHCARLSSDVTCPGELINSSQFLLDEDKNQVFFRDSSDKIEFVSLDLLKFQFRFHPLVPGEDSIFVQRCELTQNAKDVTTCAFVLMDASLFSKENGTDELVYVHNASVRFSPDMYIEYGNGSIHVCNFLRDSGQTTTTTVFLPTYTDMEIILSTIGVTLSIIALTFSFMTYLTFSSLRTRIANVLIMTLCLFLILAQLLLLVAGVATGSPGWCSVVAGLGHFFWLAAFSTSSVLGFSLVQTFSIRNQTTRGEQPSNTDIVVNLTVCLLGPVVVSGILLALFLTNGERFKIIYGSESGCWIGGARTNLFAFGVPVAVSLFVNLVFFCHVTSSICIQTRSSRKIRKAGGNIKLWREYLIYGKIFVVLSLTWTVGFLAGFIESQPLWYAFTILTSLQGVLIFLAFTVNSQVWTLWGVRLGCKKGAYRGVSTRSRQSSSSRAMYKPSESSRRTTDMSAV